MRELFKKTAEIADGMLDFLGWFGQRIEGSKNLARAEDLVGLSAEVTATINRGGVGEVVVAAGDSRLNYSARAEDASAAFKKGEIVKVLRVASSLLYVADCNEAKRDGDKKASPEPPVDVEVAGEEGK